MPLNRDVAITYLGHSTFKVVTPKQKVVVIDPWVAGNPACPEHLKTFDRLDILLCTHAHFDHIGDAVALGKKHKPKVVAIYELCHWLERKGVGTTLPMNKGGTQVVDGIRVTMVHADHSCGILDGDEILYGGEAVGYVVELENGFKFYHAGDTNIFSDMKLIADLYHPALAMLPIGDLFGMSPREAAVACRLLNARWVIPMHYATFPPLTGTPEALRKLTADLKEMEIVPLKPGETLT